MSRDQMQDAFPIVFDIKAGEQPSPAKFTGWIKQDDTAFGKITQAIGDPWEYAQHSGAGGAYYLSPERLLQTSLARFMGPSEYASPSGASFNEAVGSAVGVVLRADHNSWSLGFPFVKVITDLTPNSNLSGTVSPLDWSTDFTVVTDTDSVLTTEKTSLEEVQSDGDFYVDYYTGAITAYKVPSTSIQLQIDNIHMLVGGPPWGTHNVIPTWDQAISLCNVHSKVNAASSSTYTITLPTIDYKVRDTGSGALRGANTPYDPTDPTQSDSYWTVKTAGYGANYILPYSLTSNLSAGDEIPEGAILLWNDNSNRIMPNTTFYYQSESELTVVTSLDALDVGGASPGDSYYRLIVVGTSLAEQVEYLSDVVRDNRHIGITSGQSAPGTIAYTAPISHHYLDNLYTGILDDTTTDIDKFKFRKSSYPINDHPQYLHRAGYMDDDEDGNSGNAMRGDIVFTGAGDSDLLLVNGASQASTYGLYFGSHVTSGAANTHKIAWEGGAETTWSGSGPAAKFGFAITEVGASPAGTGNYYGALTMTPWAGLPLYLRGRNRTDDTDLDYEGGVLAFDLKRQSEMNYIKLLPGIRDGSKDPVNMPAYTPALQTSGLWSTSLNVTPDLTNRLSSDQVREFRFRGVPYIEHNRNADGSLGQYTSTHDQTTIYNISSFNGVINALLLSDYDYAADFVVGDTIIITGATNASNNGSFTVSAITFSAGIVVFLTSSSIVTENPTNAVATTTTNEFNRYFTSPGVIGADFINVYSNAIFFSEQGDGAVTSFTERGEDWMNDGTDTPTGIFYIPDDGSGARYIFSVYDTTTAAASFPLIFGDEFGFTVNVDGDISLTSENDIAIVATDDITLTTGSPINSIPFVLGTHNVEMSSVDSAYLYADNGVYINAKSNDVTITSQDNDINLSAKDTVSIEASGGVGAAIDLTADNYIRLTTTDNVSDIILDAKSSASPAYGGEIKLDAHKITLDQQYSSSLNCFIKLLNIPNTITDGYSPSGEKRLWIDGNGNLFTGV